MGGSVPHWSLWASHRDGGLDGETKHLSPSSRGNPASSAAPAGVGRGELARILQAEPWSVFMLVLLLHWRNAVIHSSETTGEELPPSHDSWRSPWTPRWARCSHPCSRSPVPPRPRALLCFSDGRRHTSQAWRLHLSTEHLEMQGDTLPASNQHLLMRQQLGEAASGCKSDTGITLSDFLLPS